MQNKNVVSLFLAVSLCVPTAMVGGDKSGSLLTGIETTFRVGEKLAGMAFYGVLAYSLVMVSQYVETKLGNSNERLGALEKRLDRRDELDTNRDKIINHRLVALSKSGKVTQNQIKAVDTRLGQVQEATGRVETAVNTLQADMRSVKTDVGTIRNQVGEIHAAFKNQSSKNKQKTSKSIKRILGYSSNKAKTPAFNTAFAQGEQLMFGVVFTAQREASR